MDIVREQSYPTPFAASPLLPMLLLSLATQKNAPKTVTTFKDEYDYIVVGGGSAGATLAARLSEESCVSILLLEAGTGNPPKLTDVPGIARNFSGTDIDWSFKTVPQKHTGAAIVNRQFIWPGGKGLGGGSLLNSMVAFRGNRKNYDDWEALGAKGWSWNDVYPYFLKMEDNRENDYLKNGYHATFGPLTLERSKYQPEVKGPIINEAKKLGYKYIDTNGAHETGFSDFQSSFRNGQRCSSSKAYLVPAENRTNLDILPDAFVTKVVLNNGKAVGVEFDYENITHIVKARREVIMSAGAINTAKLLMLSGIGPKEHLEQFEIPVVADLPVGNNLQSHVSGILYYTQNTKIPTLAQKLQNPQNIQEYIDKRSGPLSSSDFYFSTAFLNSEPVAPNVDNPDVQLYFVEISPAFSGTQVGLKPEVHNQVFGPYLNRSMFGCMSQVLQPKSRGTVRLQSANPYDPPAIDPNFLENPDDVKIIVEGMKICRKILRGDPMQKAGAEPFATPFPGCEQFQGDDDKYFTCKIRGEVKPLPHPVSTAKMGDPSDPTTVVDPLLRVKGIDGLRVVDASIMSIITSGNTNIPSIMIGEKAADIIKESISCASEIGWNELGSDSDEYVSNSYEDI